ncbi:TetR/AcrR family transcriptional regulator [Streptomyces scabiei]|uniref:TetR/AcrR family transcriptional regulator n=1 Tax=Streptomyces scabiei TaxID=1930 RepID=UPI0029BA9487|nr:TetR/AcrR family transcriptional regulator [Streptomyces scabiei]MDX3112220.1 TetR/AcrR family transcriptional regulator [Streptomyces scabiei]
MSTPQKPRTARERARIEFTAEIKAVARRQLAESGAAALSLRAVARELGLASASALYRYFPSRDALLTALILDGYTSLSDAAEAAYAALDTADAEPVAALERWAGVCHAVRDWALAHPHEYALIYGSPVPGYTAPQDTVAQATRLPYLIGALFADRLGKDGPRPGDTRTAMPDDARQSLAPLLAGLPPDTPADMVMSSLMAWTYLLGAVSFELFGHRRDIIADPRAFFDHEARRLGAALGLTA